MIRQQFYKKVTGAGGAKIYLDRVYEAYGMRPCTSVQKSCYVMKDGSLVERVTSESSVFNAAYTMVMKPSGERVAYIQITNLEVA